MSHIYCNPTDVNGDKIIDSFDVAAMRNKMVTEFDYNVICDLNHDNLVDASDLQLLQDYILGETAIFDAYYYDDADTDGICDLFEITLLKTNPDSKDTDGDTLSDYDEIVHTGTLPTTKYTNGTSVTDAEDDADKDKLTNAEEIKYKTFAFLEDSDDDKYAFIISDSPYTFTNRIGYKDVIPKRTRESLEYIYNEGVRLNFLLSPSNYNKTSAVKNLSFACNIYDFNIYSKSDLGYFSNAAFSEIYNDAIDNSPSIVAYTGSLTPKPIPKEVNRNAFINSITEIRTVKIPEADENGNINFESTVVHVGFADYDANGNLIFESYYDACEDDMLTLKGYNQLLGRLRTSTRLVLGSIQITPFSEKIMFADNDKDGLANKDDPYPDTPFDERFEIVESLEHIPQVEFTEEHYQRSIDCYDSLPNFPELYAADDDLVVLMFLSFLADNTKIPGYLFSFFYHDEGLSISDCAGKMKHASEALTNYLNNKGKAITYDSSEMYEIISSSPMNKVHLVNNLNRAMKCSEEIVNDGKQICISTTIDSNFKICCFDNKKGKEFPNGTCDIDEDEIKHGYAYYANEKHMDWQNTIGEALGGIVCQVERNEEHYTMTYFYHLSDVYEWAGHDDTTALSSILHKYHEDGRAKDFLMNGCIKGVIQWDYGDRFNETQDIEYILKNLQEVEG